MTEPVQSPLEPVGPGPEYKNRGVWLPQLFLESARQEKYVIEDRVFTECVLEGPAVILPVEGCRFDDCFFGAHGGDPAVLLMRPLLPDRVVGAIPFKNCTFTRCQFLGVGFTGSEAFLQQIQDLYRALAQQ
ncbi:hypothetical protein E4M02_04775 [Brevundimonas sp. S30B]|uniref:hypothetical protein n=1 Tax=unclassified Brevundimonas TaxID=2622653 RepID=UPI0010728629|nr:MULTISPECIES: hypothetical protein [unclassified Brevundimonas]QBX36817.1 hypothetical protein E4M01_03040 [Brevundimonas sp. MF30-B]TFW04388.1 hypothetical protein E4M02_04775 [Brevundimonas sp. S30B]